MQFHGLKRIGDSLGEGSTWAGFGVVLGTLATQLGAGYSHACYIAAGGCAAMAVLLKDKATP